ncbi:MAG: pyridoxal phosphate-dependent aminotransferase [Spirochaetia bacterium]|jgi:aminotransferase
MFNIAATMKDVISFTVGEPDFITPSNIMAAAVRSLDQGETHYTANAGLLPLRVAIAKRMRDELSVTRNPEGEIIVTAGGMEALMLGMMVLIDPGDEVIISDPHWSNYPRQVQMCGGVPRMVKVREEDAFVLDPDNVRKAVTDKTKIIILNSPSNPTGAVMDRDTQSAIARLAVQHDLFVISDEVYHHFLYDGATASSISTCDGMQGRTLVVDSFSKTYAMTGWRVGYAVGPEKVVENMVKYQENFVGCVNTQAQYAAIEALEGPQAALNRMLHTYAERRKLIVEGINGITNLSCLWPKGAFYCFVNIQNTRLSSEEFAMELLKQTGVVTVPGSGFGAAGEGYIRMSYATSEENITQGLARIRQFVESRA